MTSLEDRLHEIASVPILLVATDYDGTIAPIVSDPAQARPHREAIVALRMLSALPQTQVAVISGRALRELAELTGLPDDVRLVGSHGSEFDLGYVSELTDEALRLRERVAAELAAIARTGEGLAIEEKPASIALHYRNADAGTAERALAAAQEGPGALDGVHVKHGKMVIEMSVVATSKGSALDTIRHRCGASAAIFVGDDRTDEDAFARLRGPDVAVKVGPGESIAPHRIDGPADVARLLARLGELRAAWLEGAEATPIERHSMLSDQRTIALVTPSGRLTWMCVPRADSSALFAELLGGAAAGHFTVRPVEDGPGAQSYVDGTFVHETRWPGLTVTDFLDCSAGRPLQRAGRTDLVRIVEGTAPTIIEFAPRLDYGRISTRLRQRGIGLEVEDTLDPIVLLAPGVTWEIVQEGQHETARARVQPGPDRPIVLELRYGSGRMSDDRSSIPDRKRLTEKFWSAWASPLHVPFVQPELVRRSALVLKALCHGPTGGILAAGTTSLPEHVGGVRNWDYRYCWVRDAAMSAAALVRLGSLQEAMGFLNWMCSVIDACESPERLQPLYAVDGGTLGAEAEIAELPGYRASRPVRVGNAAARQVQLDVFGPIAELIALLVEREAPLSSLHWRVVEAMVTAVERRWQEPDHGIWEIRRPRRHHVHSKVMCWLTVDRAITVARRFLEREMPAWDDLRARIAADVLEHGFKPSVGAFTAAYDGEDLDAAALHVGLCGLLAPDDARFHGTIAAIEQGLREGPTVYRYRTDDGLPGPEGGFHICAAWLADAYALVGRRDEARRLLDEICALAGPTGMLSEQHDPRTGRALGNTPQAYSHLAVIDTAIRVEALAR